ncbi:MAG: glycine cleavage system protein H [Bdellovibrionaceae bacterium]|nr:glycine cleavage system protein H [Pseudobdellovibrionaceae bacterium]
MSMKDEYQTFMGYQWLQVEDQTLTIGINEEGLSEITDISAVHLPAENEDVAADEICAEIETDEGPLNIYCPVDGKVVEINGAVVENPSLIMEDPFGDGWLIRIEPTDASALENMDEEDDDDEDDEDYEEDDED